jgi:hypothetical protein
MAQKIATVSVWDMLDDVVVTCRVTTYDHFNSDAPQTTYLGRAQVKGQGETDDQEWLKDALVALIETL